MFLPSVMNSGQIRSSVVTRCSRTNRRDHSDLRLRRMRTGSSSEGALPTDAGRGASSRISIGRPNLIAILKLLARIA
jgi:hypothetical protein